MDEPRGISLNQNDSAAGGNSSLRETTHVPVLVEPIRRAIAELRPRCVVDGTAGGGGHMVDLLPVLPPDGLLIGIDLDPHAVELAQQRVDRFRQQTREAVGDDLAAARVVHGSYVETGEILAATAFPQCDAVLLDLGLSSDQLADEERGFSFQTDGELDLRFDPARGQPAWEFLAYANESQIADVLYYCGEERFSRRIARRIVETRRQAPIRTTTQLRDLIIRCVPRSRKNPIDPATRSFQALRIYVNGELDNIRLALERLPECLTPGGLLLIISFHSLEDRLVKHGFREDSRLEVVTRKPITADDIELHRNPRSRSAKLRIARRQPSPSTSDERQEVTSLGSRNNAHIFA